MKKHPMKNNDISIAMSYKKLDDYFEEICESKHLDKEDVINDFIKDFVNKNKSELKEKHKFYLKTDEKPEVALIFGDNGNFYELNDGSKISKSTFEKIYKSDKEPIVVNPNEFFNPLWSKEIKFEEKVKPEDFFKNTFSDWKIKKYFESIDPNKLQYYDEEDNKKVYYKKSLESEISYGDEVDFTKLRVGRKKKS